MNPEQPRRGDEFVHATFLDVTWKPGPGQKYADAPHARMVVTRVTATTVYYRLAGAQEFGAVPWRTTRAAFAARYAPQEIHHD